MLHQHAVHGLALLFLIFIVNEYPPFVAAHDCGTGGGGGGALGQFGRVYSADFETYEDCAAQCGYVTGEAEAICKAVEGVACVGESIGSLFTQVLGFGSTGGLVCNAAGGACTLTDAAYIALERRCEEYCGGKFPSKFEKNQENIDLNRKLLLKGQAYIVNNLEQLSESIANNLDQSKSEILKAFKKTTSENQEEVIRHLRESLDASLTLFTSIGLDSLDQSKSEILKAFKKTTSENQEEVLRHLRESSDASLTLLTSIENNLDVLGEVLHYNTHLILFGDVFKILDTIESRYAKVHHDQETGLIVHDFESEQYSAAIIDPNFGMLIGIEDIINMLITGDGNNWAKSKSIYEENPEEFCKQNWFYMLSLKLTRSLFHYRNGRRMVGNPVPASHSEKKYHEDHHKHYLQICQCTKEELPTIKDKTVKCKDTSSNPLPGTVCQVECWGQDRDSVFCTGGGWTVDKLWLQGGVQGSWACKAEQPLSYPVLDIWTKVKWHLDHIGQSDHSSVIVSKANYLFSLIVNTEQRELFKRKEELVHGKVIDTTCETHFPSSVLTISDVTPLHMALITLQPDEEIITMLLSAGADPNIVSVGNFKGQIFRQSPLYTAASVRGMSYTVQQLLDSGAHVDYANSDINGDTNTTALYIACSLNYPETAKILINGGANINIALRLFWKPPLKSNIRETTPLYRAVYNGMVSTVKLLMSKGARTDIDSEPNTLLYAAKYSGNQMLINMFN